MPRRALVPLLATLFGLALLWAAARHLDGAAVGRALAGARGWPWLPLGLASYAAGHRLRGLRLRRLLSHEVSLPAHTATNVVLVGYAVNNVLPARLGEVARAWFLMERSGLAIAQTLTITLVERLLDALVLLALFAATLGFVPASPLLAAALPIAGGLLAVTALAAALGAWAPGTVLGFASRAAIRMWPAGHDRVMRRMHAILAGLEPLRHARTVAAVLALSLLVWIFEAGLFLALLPAFGFAVVPVNALFVMTGTNLGLLLPSTPGFVGPFHFFCAAAMESLGAPRETAFGYAVLVHAAFFVPVTLYGVGVLAAHGLSVGRTLALSREAEPLTAGPGFAGSPPAPRVGATSDPPPTRFLLALAEAAVPIDRDRIEGEEARPLVREVASFVGGQLHQLPVRLRALFYAGLAVFRVATRLRFLHGFCDLPADVRRRWFEDWAYGRLPLARQLFRPVRSTALLAYYERPEVRAALERSAP